MQRSSVMKNAIRVFAFQSVEQILSRGGTGSWHVKPENAARREYAVITRNARDERLPRGSTEQHRSAFMIGKISGVEPDPRMEGRYVFIFSEYALINVPDAWAEAPRNPVGYCNL